MKIFHNIRQHPIVSVIVALLASALLIFAFSEGKFLKMTAYLAAILATVLVTDWLAAKFKTDDAEFLIKSPAKELKLLLATQAIVVVISIIRFQVFTDWQNTGSLFKLPIFFLMLLFVFPVVLIAAFLKWRYS
ncbi:MAG: hypothetical protein ABJA66_18155, partial [Actinomycetota bacterium]